MNLKVLNNRELEHFNEKEINELIIESLFPLENKESKFYTIPNNRHRFPIFVSKNELHD